MPFGNYKFAKSPYVVISGNQIITKSDPRDVAGRHMLEDPNSCSLFEGRVAFNAHEQYELETG